MAVTPGHINVARVLRRSYESCISSGAAALSRLWRASAIRHPILLALRSSADPTAADVRDPGHAEQRTTNAYTHSRRNHHNRSGARKHNPGRRSEGVTPLSATDLERCSVRRRGCRQRRRNAPEQYAVVQPDDPATGGYASDRRYHLRLEVASGTATVLTPPSEPVPSVPQTPTTPAHVQPPSSVYAQPSTPAPYQSPSYA